MTTPTLSREGLLVDPAAYAPVRAARRAAMLPVRRERRVRLGDQLACEFENAETLRYQVQEMLYVELAGAGDLDAEQLVAEELAVYGRLLPGPTWLCATLFIELDDLATVRTELARLEGIQHAVSLQVGAHVVPGVELPAPDDPEARETVSVHMLKFEFSPAAAEAFRDQQVPASLVVDHPQYRVETALAGAARASLAADLS